jgi:hypothetical protein
MFLRKCPLGLVTTSTALVVTTLLIAAASAVTGENQPQSPKPIFIVGAHTALHDPGTSILNAPTMRSQWGRTLLPTNAGVEHIRHQLRLSRFHFALLLFLCGICVGAAVLCFLSSVIQHRSVSALIKDVEIAKQHASALKIQVMNRVLKDAIALSLKTENFSEAARRTAASAQRDHVLATHAEIEAKEAERIANARARAAHYEGVAAHAAPKSELGHAAIVDILRNADEWEYQVLQEAKKLAVEEAK